MSGLEWVGQQEEGAGETRPRGRHWPDRPGPQRQMKEFWFEPQKDRKPQRVKQGTFILIMFVFSLKDHVGCQWRWREGPRG